MLSYGLEMLSGAIVAVVKNYARSKTERSGAVTREVQKQDSLRDVMSLH